MAKNNFKKMAKQIAPGDIPEEVIQKIKYPSLLSQIRRQEEDGCALSSMRSMFLLQFGLEKELEYYEKLAKRLKIDKMKKNEISPSHLADMIHYASEKQKRVNTKVFATTKGNYGQLEWLSKNSILPIIHRKTVEDGNAYHYEILIGLNKEEVFLYNSARCLCTSGFYKIPKENFKRDWWPVKTTEGKERWYLAVTENGMNLPIEKFQGKYL